MALAQSFRMDFTYKLAERDFLESLIAYRNSRPLSKWFVRLSVILVLLFLVLGIVGLVVHPSRQNLSNVVPLLALAVMWIVLLWVSPWWAARKQFRKQPAAQGLRTISLDGGGVRLRWDGGASDVEWKTFIRFLESKNQFLLFTSPVNFAIIPKRALTAEQITECRAMLEEKVPPRQ